MIVVRCKECNKELTSHPGKTKCCGCSNMTTLIGDKLSAVDLGLVVMIDSGNMKKKNKNVLSSEDIAWQEQRRKRKVRKLDFEVR
jgi:hypothetical protein